LQSQVLGQHGATAAYIPPLLLSVLAELRAASDDAQRLVQLPTWGRVSEVDPRYLSHQWAKKADARLIPEAPASLFTPPPCIPSRPQVIQRASSPPPEAGPSRKRAAEEPPSPPHKATKRPKAKPMPRPVVLLPVPKGARTKSSWMDSMSESGGDEEDVRAQEKGKGKGKAKMTSREEVSIVS
jgi:hypothetical protein